MGVPLITSHTTDTSSSKQTKPAEWPLYTTSPLSSPHPSPSAWSSPRHPPPLSLPLSLATHTTARRPLTPRRSSSSPRRLPPLLPPGALLSLVPVSRPTVLLLYSMPLVLSATRALPTLAAWSSLLPLAQA